MVGRRLDILAPRGDDALRIRIAQEAARIMAVEGVRDFAAAKRKAAARLNQSENRHLPSNREIEEALADYLRLFHARDLPHILRGLLDTALEAMRLLNPFDPRLTGPVLQGVATPYSEVQIHAFADDPEQVAVLLQDHGIPYDEDHRRLRYGGDRQETAPVFRFIAGDTTVEITALPRAAAREAPLSPVDARPMKRANLRQVERLYADASQAPESR
jgi:hypothetical protein